MTRCGWFCAVLLGAGCLGRPAAAAVRYVDAAAAGAGDGSSWANAYALHDWRLDRTSPCIDAGDPASDWSNEPDYPAGHIDMGAYGNTVEASTTNAIPMPLLEGLALIVH